MISNGVNLDTLKSNFYDVSKRLGFGVDIEYKGYDDISSPKSTSKHPKERAKKETTILLGNVEGFCFPLKWVFDPKIIPEDTSLERAKKAYNNERFDSLIGIPITFDEPVDDIIITTKKSPYVEKAKTILSDIPEVNFINMMTPTLIGSTFCFDRETRLLFAGKNKTTGQKYGVFYSNTLHDFVPKKYIPIYMCWVAELKSLGRTPINCDTLFFNWVAYKAETNEGSYLVSTDNIKHLYKSVYGVDKTDDIL